MIKNCSRIIILMLWVCFSSGAFAAGLYPSRPIRVLVPFAAGSGTDVNTRQVTGAMTRHLNNAVFVVENRPGANGFIAAEAAARAEPDGHTIFVSTNTTHAANPHLFKKLPYSPLVDFVPIGIIGQGAPVLLRGSAAPVDSMSQVLELAKKRPEGLNFAVTNASSELATKLFARLTGVKVHLVPYKAAPQALTDLASGQIDFLFGDVAAAGGLLKAGALKGIGVAAPKRLASHPHIPTMQEEGVKGVETQIWIGLFAPKGTPPEVVARLSEALVKTLEQPDIKEALLQTGIGTVVTTPEQAARYVAAQYETWTNTAKVLGIEPQ